MIKGCVSVGAVIAVGLLLAGCYTDYGPVAATPEAWPPPAAASLLQIGDRVTVTVYDEPNLTGVYEVTPAGNLDLPLIGSVKAAGRTPTELNHVIADRYKRGKFLEEPKVTIAIVDYRPIYLMGEVVRPGPMPYRSGLNALTVIASAGGVTYRGSRSSILIQRSGEQVWTEYPVVSAVTIMPGDVIRVPERYY